MLSAADRLRLRQFVRLVFELRTSRLITTYCETDQTIAVGPLPADNVHPQYDREDFDAFLTRFRQVAINNDGLKLDAILNLVDRHIIAKHSADHPLRSITAEIRKVTLPLMRKGAGMFRVAVFDEEQKPLRSLTSHETLLALVNGQVFHSDPEHAPVIELLDGSEPWTYLWPILFEVIEPTLRGCLYLYQALYIHGLLTQEDYPAAAFPQAPPAR